MIMAVEGIKVRISPKGVPTITVTGVKGPACKALTAELEADLGEVTSDTPTAEYTQISTDVISEQEQRKKQK